MVLPLQVAVTSGDNELTIELPPSYLEQPVAVRAELRRGVKVLASQTEWFSLGEVYVFLIRWREDSVDADRYDLSDSAAVGDDHGH